MARVVTAPSASLIPVTAPSFSAAVPTLAGGGVPAVELCDGGSAGGQDDEARRDGEGQAGSWFRGPDGHGDSSGRADLRDA